MKKVLIMANTLYSGGAERVLQTMLNHLDEKKYSITLYSMHREEIDSSIYKSKFRYKYLFDEKKEGNIIFCQIYNLGNKIKGYIFSHFSSKVFYALFMHGKYDVEIAFIEGESTKIIAGSPNRNSKKIAWVHIDLEQNPWTSFLYKNDSDEANHYKRFNKIVCVSEATKLAFCKKYKINLNSVITHYNPIDADFIRKEADKSTETILDVNTIQIVAVGRLVTQKGFDRLLVATKRLLELGLNFQLHIIGSGEEYEVLKKYIEDNALSKIVVLHGYQKNPYSLMKQGDILVCSSRAEGYSLVIAEAMILGLAIVTTDCSGPCELIDNGKYGVLIQNTTEGIYDGLKRILMDRDLLEKYKLLSKKRSSMFNVGANIQKLEQIIDE